MLTFDTDGMVQQKFPFPAPIMDYIFKNLAASQLLKLYKTCKFFYDKFKLNIIEDFEICCHKHNERIVGNSMAIWQQNPSLSKLKNLWISNTFTLYNFRGEHALDFGKFSRLTYKTLDVCGAFTAKEYQFLVECPTLRDLIVTGEICDSDTKMILSIEECIERAPHVSTICLCLEPDGFMESLPPLDMTKLLSLERQTKITSMNLYNVSNVPDPLVVVEFFKKHAIPEIDYYFDFDEDDDDFDVENVKTFYKTVDTELQAWKFSLQLPSTISSFINLTGKIAVITGAGEGIGRATALLFRELGASVIAVSRNRGRLNDLFRDCHHIKTTGFIHTVFLDMTDADDIERLFERIDYKFGTKFDILVNNNDILEWDAIANFNAKEEIYDYCNIVRGRYELIQTATPYLTQAKGTVIKVLSSHGLKKPEYALNDSTERKIKIAEIELASSGVRINSVNPGSPPTVLPRPDGMNDTYYKKYLQETKKTYEKEVANAIAYLASAKLIDGAVLPINALNFR